MNATPATQRRITFPDHGDHDPGDQADGGHHHQDHEPRETQAERCRRLLSGDVGRVVKRASELTFTPAAAREAERKAKQ